MQVWNCRDLEAWRYGGREGLEVWKRGRVERDSKLWRWSKGLEDVSEGLEDVSGSEVVNTKLWRR
jgi:hypothetical protein